MERTARILPVAIVLALAAVGALVLVLSVYSQPSNDAFGAVVPNVARDADAEAPPAPVIPAEALAIRAADLPVEFQPVPFSPVAAPPCQSTPAAQPLSSFITPTYLSPTTAVYQSLAVYASPADANAALPNEESLLSCLEGHDLDNVSLSPLVIVPSADAMVAYRVTSTVDLEGNATPRGRTLYIDLVFVRVGTVAFQLSLQALDQPPSAPEAAALLNAAIARASTAP